MSFAIRAGEGALLIACIHSGVVPLMVESPEQKTEALVEVEVEGVKLRGSLAIPEHPKELRIIPGATHLFEEPGTLEQVADLARDWSSGSGPRCWLHFGSRAVEPRRHG